ncbi:hypothetical protein F5B22DRAFT_571694 [Xylaria bambusicola]|uniref:uncharacterized protein n=1 Tax=Xylaria bambusicola TaxID=326684 RepID=UPI0020084AA5|nr:uncharacterized protein F5B22DRAFT_571694 [Xylaria bambusicola]KAI0521390.1 hypothetical protein F5B22DRAFT_571694 [Xylaria bambusicola]
MRDRPLNCCSHQNSHLKMSTPIASQAANQSQSTPTDSPKMVEARVQLAVNAYKLGKFATFKAAAEAFGAPYQRVRRRYNGNHSRQENGGHNKVLNEALETALHSALQRLIVQGTKISSHRLWRTTNELLKTGVEEGQEPRQVRQRWARRYLARNRDLFPRVTGKGPGNVGNGGGVTTTAEARRGDRSRDYDCIYIVAHAGGMRVCRSKYADVASKLADRRL